MIKYILFDLDGTLLPMDQDNFIRAYFGGLAKKLMPLGYDKEQLIGAIWQGMGAMIKNNGKALNEVRFWDAFAQIYGENARKDEGTLTEFYENEFDAVQNSCGFDKRASDVIDLVRSRGFKAVLATNPVFPSIATEKRMKWAGLSPADFEIFTHYGNSHYCKPNLDYYREILSRLGADASECVMIGNDVCEDMVARELGMRVFLLTDCLINKENRDICEYPNGSFDELRAFILSL